MKPWHSTEIDDVLSELKTTKKGLDHAHSRSRLEEYGKNELIKKANRSPLKMFVGQFKSILVIILIIAAGISLALGELPDGIAIGVIVLLNAFFGFHQEYKAEKAIEALKKMVVPKIIVYRDGKPIEVSARDIVPGDVVDLEEGNRVPADIRLFEVTNLRIDESALTGESTAVTKVIKVLKEKIQTGDKINMAFMGTLVSAGRGKGVVVATGMKTELGKIASLVQEKEEPTPLQIKLDKFGITIGKLTLVIAVGVFLFGMFVVQLELFTIFLTSVSLAVAVIPEGLPAVVALTLSLGTQRMLKKNVVIRKLASVEALGSATVICSDKTGTMTTNEMTVEKIYTDGKIIDVTGTGFDPTGEFTINGRPINTKTVKGLENVFRVSMMCNNSILRKDKDWKVIGDPTEGAMKVAAMKSGFKEEYERLDEIPFSSFRKKMTTINKVGNKNIAYTKGAPEIVLDDCKVTKAEKDKVMKIVHEFAENGMRVLGLAYKEVGKTYTLKKVESGMKFVGLVAMIDPPRKETKNSIKLCKEAGIRTIMMTGDHKLTAQSIAHKIGIEGDVITGNDIDEMSEKDLTEKVKTVSIFARISPEHKLKIVKTLQASGEVVAVSGDGVNDAPALKAAEIGVAMGIKGSDVSKEAASMILLDDNFSSIVSAIEEGRGVYNNIKKFVRYLLAANGGEILFITVPIMLAFAPELLPTLLPVQLLWINLITDGIPALALGVDPKEKDIMKVRPRSPKESILQYSWTFIIAGGVISFLVVFAVFMMYIDSGIDKARTMAFSTLVIFEMFFVFNCRSDTRGVFRFNPFNNKWLIIAVISSIILQVAVVHLEFFQTFLGTVPLELEEWAMVFAFGSIGLFVIPEFFNGIARVEHRLVDKIRHGHHKVKARVKIRSKN